MRQEEAYLTPASPAVGWRCFIYRLKGVFNRFLRVHNPSQSAKRLRRDRPRKQGVAELNMLCSAVLHARGPMRMVRPGYTRILASIATREKRFGGDLMEQQYAPLPTVQ